MLEEMRASKIGLLLNIAKRGGLQNAIRVTSGELASEMGISQQTANRWLLELQSEGLVQRRFRSIELTAQTQSYLQALRKEVESLFEKTDRELRLLGRVMTGMKEGRFYLSIPEYKEQIRKALGHNVYAGTLNLRLSNEKSIEGKRMLMGISGIDIAGFRKNGRLLGGAKLFKAGIIGRRGSCEGAVIVPYRSHYGTEIVEIVSSDNLRKKLKLKNRDEVEVSVRI